MSTTEANTLRLYGELLAHSDSWGGKLVLASGEGISSTGIAAATCVAGGCALVLDSNSQAVRACFRDGGVDFIVNTLDEALRTLKNEVRQHRPLGVALLGDTETHLEEAAERGLLPDLALSDASFPAHASLPLNNHPSPRLRDWLRSRGWHEATVATTDIPTLLQSLAANDPRHRWLSQLPRYQRSARGADRSVWLSATDAPGRV